jgi:oxygen-independent coproporphyrinogen-3 oxidase
MRRLDRNGPRYTSYPTADRFVDAFDAHACEAWARLREADGVQRPLSLYVHIPFCNTVCFYCGCNKIVTRDRSKTVKYLHYLYAETAMRAALHHGDPPVEQLHLGGGTPTFLSVEQMRELVGRLRQHFSFSPGGEYSIEIDPRSVAPETIYALADIGFNRASLGIQDFDPEVQKAVNRIQSERQTLDIIDAARRAGFKSINVDLIYGLPKQTPASVLQTIDKVVAARPERVALYNYAHLPALFKPQRRINEAELPAPADKLRILSLAIGRLTDAGYLYIGMDHFAVPEDELAVAQRQRRLHRNFQGYSTHADCDLLALGVSAIGTVGPTYYQNYRVLDDYCGSIERGVLPIMRGIELSADDCARRAIIQALMCHFELSIEAIEAELKVPFAPHFAIELAELHEFEQEGMLTIDQGWIRVTPKGRLLIRNICMVFDQYLRRDPDLRRYSKVI